jgi:hypothetical protein
MSVRQEALTLVLAVLVVDAVFVAVYFLGNVRSGSDATKLAFTVIWTFLTLAVVIRGLSRIRTARVARRSSKTAE